MAEVPQASCVITNEPPKLSSYSPISSSGGGLTLPSPPAPAAPPLTPTPASPAVATFGSPPTLLPPAPPSSDAPLAPARSAAPLPPWSLPPLLLPPLLEPAPLPPLPALADVPAAAACGGVTLSSLSLHATASVAVIARTDAKYAIFMVSSSPVFRRRGALHARSSERQRLHAASPRPIVRGAFSGLG